MKKYEREIYYALASLKWWGLCNFCRYALDIGSCELTDLECHCGIESVEERLSDVWAGGDCWMFKPQFCLDDTVDMVGLWLQGKHVDMSQCKRIHAIKVEVIK